MRDFFLKFQQHSGSVSHLIGIQTPSLISTLIRVEVCGSAGPLALTSVRKNAPVSWIYFPALRR